MAIAFVQKVAAPTVLAAGGTSRTVSLPGAVTVGNDILVVAACWRNSGNPPALTVTDNLGNTYASVAGRTQNQNRLELFRAKVTNAGTPTVTISWASGTDVYMVADVAEFSGMAASPNDLAYTTTVGTGTSVTATSSTATTQADEMVWAGWEYGGSLTNENCAISAPYTQQNRYVNASNATSYVSGYKIVSATGTQSATFTHSSDATGDAPVVLICSFKAAATTTTVDINTLGNFSTGSPTFGSASATIKANLGLSNFTTGSPAFGSLAATISRTLSLGNFSTGSPVFDSLGVLVAKGVGLSNFSTASPVFGSISATLSHPIGLSAFATASPAFGSVNVTLKKAMALSAFSTGSPVFGALAATIRASLGLANFSTGSPVFGAVPATITHPLGISAFSTGSPVFGSVGVFLAKGVSLGSFTTGSPVFGSVALQSRLVIGLADFTTESPVFDPFTVALPVKTVAMGLSDFVVGSPSWALFEIGVIAPVPPVPPPYRVTPPQKFGQDAFDREQYRGMLDPRRFGDQVGLSARRVEAIRRLTERKR